MKTVRIRSSYPPAITNFGDGRRKLACGTLFFVNERASVEADYYKLARPGVKLVWEPYPKLTPASRQQGIRTSEAVVRKARGSNGKIYEVTLLDGRPVNCTCPGFTYRRHCKHTANI